jgi:hypothetical protein
MNASLAENDDRLSPSSNLFFFEDYVETTLDPGWSLVIGSLIACILLHATLPCMVSLGSRYERRRVIRRWHHHHHHHHQSHKDDHSTDDDDDDDDDNDNDDNIIHNNEDHRQGNHCMDCMDDIQDEFSIKKSRRPSILLDRIHSIVDPNYNGANMIKKTTGGNISIMVHENLTSSSSRDLESSGIFNPSPRKKTKRKNSKNQPTNQYHNSVMAITTTMDKEQGVLIDEENDSHPPIGRMRHEKSHNSLRMNRLAPVPEKSMGSNNLPAWFGDDVVQWFCGVKETVRTQERHTALFFRLILHSPSRCCFLCYTLVSVGSRSM